MRGVAAREIHDRRRSFSLNTSIHKAHDAHKTLLIHNIACAMDDSTAIHKRPLRVRKDLLAHLTLSPDQELVLKYIALRRANVLLVASAGTGKSRVIAACAIAASIGGARVAVTAFTGTAAVGLARTCRAAGFRAPGKTGAYVPHGHGVAFPRDTPPPASDATLASDASETQVNTLHSWMGIRMGDTDPDTVAARLITTQSATTRACIKRWRTTDLLIIDEVSMMHPSQLRMLDGMARILRGQVDTVFGGMQVMMVGDFLQLPAPHVRDASGKVSEDENVPLFASPVFGHGRFVPCTLTTQHRAKDPEFAAMLSRLRWGRVTPDDVAALQSKITPFSSVADDAVVIVPTKDRVAEWNAQCLERDVTASSASGEGDEGSRPVRSRRGAPSGPECAILISSTRVQRGRFGTKAVTRGCIQKHKVPSRLGEYTPSYGQALPAYVGMPVRITQNIRGDDGSIVVANGQRGVISGFSFKPPFRVTVVPDTWRLVSSVQFDLEIYPLEQGGRWVWPLAQASALTAHSVQGMTLGKIGVDLSSKLFEPQQAYVALSRGQRWQDVCVISKRVHTPSLTHGGTTPAHVWSQRTEEFIQASSAAAKAGAAASSGAAAPSGASAPSGAAVPPGAPSATWGRLHSAPSYMSSYVSSKASRPRAASVGSDDDDGW